MQEVLCQMENSVLTITINRPEKMNSLNVNVLADLRGAIERARTDSMVRCVVLCGAGKGFSSGDDLKGGMLPKDEKDRRVAVSELGVHRRARDEYGTLVEALRALPKPVICKIHGFAVGAGFELCLGCDLRYAADDTKFSLPFALRGISAGGVLLPRFVGLTRAVELLFTGRTFYASEAESLGLLTGVFPAGELDAAVDGIARQLAESATFAIGLTKQTLYWTADKSVEEGLLFQAFNTTLTADSYDCQEGKKAFLEKRKPEFKGC